MILVWMFAVDVATAKDATTKCLATPSDLASQIQQSIQLGRTLYFYDKASAIATDALAAHIGSLENKGHGGYLTLQEGDDAGKPLGSWLILFFSGDVEPRISYRVHVYLEKGRVPQVEPVSPPEQVSPQVLALYRARRTALDAAKPFYQAINPVILPAEVIGQKGVLVELLAATNKPRIAVLGKHYRVFLTEDGQKVTQITPLSKAILELPMVDEKGANVAALTVTHLVTDYPLETHVFASMLNKIPIYVGTSRGIWKIDGDTICLISEGPPGSKEKSPTQK